MELGIFEVVSGLIILALSCYYYFVCPFNFWESRGISGPKPTFLYGNFKNVLLGKMSIGDFVKQEYDKFKDLPMFGIYVSHTPILIINDAELIKDILIKDFSSFANRGIRLFEKVEPLSPNLVNLEAARWRPMRAKQNKMFSSAKLKDMFPLLVNCADNLERILLEKITEVDDIVECCEVTARFSTDVIGVCVFGLDMKALDDENSQFRRVGRKFIHADRWRAFKLRFKQIFPTLYTILGPIMYDHEINDFFIKTILNTMNYRNEHNVLKRGDFVDLLMDLKNNAYQLKGIGMYFIIFWMLIMINIG